MSGERIVDGVTRFVDQGVVNWYLVETDEGPVAIDAGFPTAWRQIAPRARELRAIVLTHAHIDHMGFAEHARKRHGIPVYVPQRDDELCHTIKWADHERNPLEYVLRHAATRRLYWRALRSGAAYAKTLQPTHVFGPDHELPGGLRPVSTPGHTYGHMALHLVDRDVIFAGDAIVTHDPYTDRAGPRLVARAATADAGRAKASLDAIAETGATYVLTGHGEPWTEGAAEAARRAREAGAA
jgi:glyoxylase-like metal-dependent hydrolase (beta-lactamase superfamily II)